MLHDSDLFAVYDRIMVKKILISEAMFKLVASKKILQSEPWTSWGQENCLSTPKGCTGATTSVGSSR